MDGVGELGQAKDWANHGAARKRLRNAISSTDEAKLKAARNYGAPQWSGSKALPQQAQHLHFGPLIVSCDHADLRPTPQGVWIDGETEVTLDRLEPPQLPRSEVIDEFYNAIFHEQAVLHSGTWARATTAVSLAILASAHQHQHQVPTYQVQPVR
jgi:phthalate 4,5-cis-dihydrodiol dehydrogenase